MPIYDFHCETCGEFAVMRPIAERDAPWSCPDCGGAASRMVSAPAIALMSGAQRKAFATNERAANAPLQSGDGAAHRYGCGCCSGGKVSLAGADGASQGGGLKSPSGNSRPWMISH
ncbi:FmdB family transcriptional regulator [Burkholderia sp. WAC0059]|uniref:FmdB family zinc ribbon protein n=1 Tax=Burkholderia sp. WAC0059 TaxID=2066022 RepID=UPI000C7EAF59|nr:zinc ribbon domain-containing protein [Burkholderia sp. WAC0059]PLZ03079.1 FmdB family transcriptional regulator [Burkholderia sp. WAC0059]